MRGWIPVVSKYATYRGDDSGNQHNRVFRSEPSLSYLLADSELEAIIIQLPWLGNVAAELAPFGLQTSEIEQGELELEGLRDAKFVLVEEHREMRLEIGEVGWLNKYESKENPDFD